MTSAHSRSPQPELHRLLLRHPGGFTPILVGQGALAEARPELERWLAGRTAFVVSTPRVLALHGERLAPLRDAAAQLRLLEVEEGEAAKTVATAERLWSQMLLAGGKRDSRLIAFGGGSVGDLAGFAAGCFLRGIEVTQLPTTLLAQVDAAIGGKTAVDLPGGKNAVGLFHHPAHVLCDTALLATLPREELRSGLVEVIKAAALLEPALLARVEGDLAVLLAGDPAALAPVVAAAAAAKVGVVERDPDERGERGLLNFGHTLGHAIESALGYAGLRHGEAVAYGMLFALRLARRRGLDAAVAGRLGGLLLRLGLPPLPALDAQELAVRMARDKKARERGLVWVLPAALGDGRMVEGIGWEEVMAELRAFLRDPTGGVDRKG
ncbi:MAG TPA: 3-dehydroquinate synthase family protein [Thermoanaerobaculia bacterium]|nr:3-dehydroquinate synthase family protein [Thermoanaerobaculia bacterium]